MNAILPLISKPLFEVITGMNGWASSGQKRTSMRNSIEIWPKTTLPDLLLGVWIQMFGQWFEIFHDNNETKDISFQVSWSLVTKSLTLYWNLQFMRKRRKSYRKFRFTMVQCRRERDIFCHKSIQHMLNLNVTLKTKLKNWICFVDVFWSFWKPHQIV